MLSSRRAEKIGSLMDFNFFFLASLGKIPKLEDDHLNSPLHKQLNHVLNQSNSLNTIYIWDCLSTALQIARVKQIEISYLDTYLPFRTFTTLMTFSFFNMT